MKRYVDSLFFLLLLIIDVFFWAFTVAAGDLPRSVVVVAPALVSLILLGLGRTLVNMDAKKFYAFLAPAAAVFGLAMLITDFLTPPLESYDFNTGAYVMFASAIGALLGLFLGLVGAVASPEAVRAEQEAARAQKLVEKAEEKHARQAERAAAKAARKANVEQVDVTEVVDEAP